MGLGVVEKVLPGRLGRPFRWLVGATWLTNLGDGVVIAAGPLLVASETRDPFLVALAPAMNLLPALLFGLHAGVVADRVDRRLLLACSDAARLLVLVLLVLAVATGWVSIALVLVAMFLVGTGETFADTASMSLVPEVVDKRELGVANSRLMVGHVVLNQLAGAPVGAALFALGRSLPFAFQALLVLAGIVLVLRVRVPRRPEGPRAPSTVRADIVAGLRWTWQHAAVRTLVLTILIFNVTFGAAWAVLVLYALERLSLGEVGFGLLTSALAVGGVAGTVCYSWLEAHVRLGTVMRAGLVVETLTHLGLALTTSAWAATAIFVVFGAHAAIWGTISAAVRQRAVPLDMQGRVNSVNRIGSLGGIVLGSVLGGVLATHWGVTAPFWFAFAGSALFLAAIWRQLAHVAHADEEIVARA